jgi:hypothetical protein
MLNKKTNPAKNKKFHSFIAIGFLISFSISLFSILSICQAPIIGDDLIAPFIYWIAVDGNFKQALQIGFEQGVNGHFNFFGRLASGIWNFSWIASDENFSSHQIFYDATRMVCILIGYLGTYLSVRNLTALKVNSIVIHSFVLPIYFGTIQYHALWSNDPVSNYPLFGYPSSALGIYTLVHLNRIKSSIPSQTEKRIVLVLLLTSISILFYELNLALIPVLFVFFARNLKDTLQSHKKLGLISISICVIGLLYTSQNSNVYPGTEVSLSPEFFRASLIAFFSAMPMSNFPLAFLATKDEVRMVTYVCIFLLLMLSTAIFIRPLWLNRSVYFNDYDFAKFEVFALFGLMTVFTQSLSEKIQSETFLIGHVYMAFSTLHMILVIIMSTIVIDFFNLKRENVLYFAVILLLGVQTFVNHLIIEETHSKFQMNSRIVQSLTFASETDRCEVLRLWQSGSWPIPYAKSLESGLNGTFYSRLGTPYCSVKP